MMILSPFTLQNNTTFGNFHCQVGSAMFYKSSWQFIFHWSIFGVAPLFPHHQHFKRLLFCFFEITFYEFYLVMSDIKIRCQGFPTGAQFFLTADGEFSLALLDQPSALTEKYSNPNPLGIFTTKYPESTKIHQFCHTQNAGVLNPSESASVDIGHILNPPKSTTNFLVDFGRFRIPCSHENLYSMLLHRIHQNLTYTVHVTTIQQPTWPSS